VSDNRGRFLYVAVVIAESSWIYAAAGIPCLILGLDGAPLPWAAVAGVLGIGMLTAWVFGGARGDAVRLAIVQSVIGLAVIYVALGARRFDDSAGIDLLWVGRVFGGEHGRDGLLGLVLGLALAILLWLRAVNLVSGGPLAERIQRTFRIGMAAVSAALIAELATGNDIGARLVLLPFFGATLAGMAVARLVDPGRGGRTGSWARVVGGSVGAILLVGLALGVLSGAYGSGALRLLQRGWGALVDGLLWVLHYPLQGILMALLAIFRWLASLFNPSGERTELPDAGGLAPKLGERAEEAVGGDWVEALVDVLQYPVAVILAAVVFFVLVLAYRRLRRRAAKKVSARESIKGDADVGRDFVDLFGRLLPAWMRRKEGTAPWRYPEGEPGITEVFILYFGYLSEAIRQGMHLDTRQTPNERREVLEQALPGAPVRVLTNRFNAACYGRERSDSQMIASLGQSLEHLRQEGRGRRVL